MSRITIGTIAKPQGVRGELKVSPLTDSADRFKLLKEVFVGGKRYAVTNSKINPKGVFITLEGVNDRDVADMLRNQLIEVDRKDAVKLSSDVDFIVDVIGSKVYFDGEESHFGVLDDILQHGAADVYVIKELDGKVAMVPYIAPLMLVVDSENKRVVLDRKVYGDLVVYED